MPLSHRLAVSFLIPFLAFTLSHAADETTPVPVKDLAEMSKAGNLFNKDSYKKVRNCCVRLFEERNAAAIKAAYSSDYEAMETWFEKQKEIKEELYSALDEKNDKIEAALKIFHALWKKNPDAVAKYSNLAIAFSVVWDNPRGSVYDYRQHQTRTRSILPESYGKIGPEEFFQDFIDRQKELQNKEALNRLQALPWEFLIYVVDHQTPIDERKWAATNYLQKRPLIGKIYSTVKYDNEMLNTQSKICKLNDKPYTLSSILQHGGVCAMQADFAARTSKSILVPAAYIRGESQFQGLHAWVMWVEVQSAGTQIKFTLESHGRYFTDNYYTGDLNDPQTGLKILNRDMERRLSAVARDRVGKRHAELLMERYEDISKARELDQKRRILFLDKCLMLSPYNEAAWLELARQVKQGELDAEAKTAVLAHVESMLRTFATYPDFSWKIANDLILIQDNKMARNQFYSRLVALYENAGRPDLACEARLKWASFQTEDDKWQLAAQGLAQTIQKFPGEGRYIPKLIDLLKESGGKYKGGVEYVAAQFRLFLPKIPVKRGSEVNKFCVQMHELAIAYFKDNKKDKDVKDLEARLQAVKAGKQ